MGRWTQYDEDSYRLPPGVKRTAYDADTGVYTYRDGNGQIYTGAPHQRYGTLRPISQPPAETRAMFDKDKAPLSVDTKSPGPAPKSFADILSPDQVTSAPPIHGGRSPTKPTSPKSRFIDAVRRATAPKMLDVVHNATTSHRASFASDSEKQRLIPKDVPQVSEKGRGPLTRSATSAGHRSAPLARSATTASTLARAATSAGHRSSPPVSGLARSPTNASNLTSEIVKVNLSPGRAEVTRIYRSVLKVGLNQLKISGLPTDIDCDSLRVEIQGTATIQDVSIRPLFPAMPDPAVMSMLEEEYQSMSNRVRRCRDASFFLENYLRKVEVRSSDHAQLPTIMQTYEHESSKIDDRLAGLERELEKLRLRRIDQAQPTYPSQLTATINVFADNGGEAEIALVYAVPNASWQASYDIRINMQSKNAPFTIRYKAAIHQSTGENWDNIQLTLDTVNPIFGVEVPSLGSCRLTKAEPVHPTDNLSEYYPSYPAYPKHQPMVSQAIPPQEYLRSRIPQRNAAFRCGTPPCSPSRSRSWSPHPRSVRSVTPPPPAIHAPRYLTPSSPEPSFGGIYAMYDVPGLTSIPNDAQDHNVTIAELKLGATLSWLVVPKVDLRAHLKAQVKNTSEYTLVAGPANVYIDGSFVAMRHIPTISPQEIFECSLGKETFPTGPTNKTTTTAYSRQATIRNTKSIAIEDLKILDRIPVSGDSQIVVKLINPALCLPAPSKTERSPLDGAEGYQFETTSTLSLKVSENVTAQWEGEEGEMGTGSDGRLSWLCTIPPQGMVSVNVQSDPWALDQATLLRATMITIPLDIVDLILQYLVEDIEALRECSLVHKFWVQPAQRLIFNKFTFHAHRDPDYSKCAQQAVILAGSPHLAIYIQHVEVHLGATHLKTVSINFICEPPYGISTTWCKEGWDEMATSLEPFFNASKVLDRVSLTIEDAHEESSTIMDLMGKRFEYLKQRLELKLNAL
ncbi:hypothetical protein EYR38_003517 [Pleurotus pulmonarius]|nr:hypothetical protein EYR38_003517 [Pleurotus pulmonarius]